jgi:aspartate kinase
MALVVQKYGGSSVADLERIKNVANRVKKTVEEGNQVAVVVSAMKGVTDRLDGMFKEIAADYSQEQYDMAVSTGEQVSVGLLSATLISMGVPAQSFCGWQIPIQTDSAFMKARICSIENGNLKKALDEGKVAVIAGFQGLSPEGRITTMGRGGSDTSAIAVAAALKADICDIYTDVDGIYTADPRIVKRARKLDKITFEELLELASLGAKVMQIRAVEFAMKHNVSFRVRSSFSDGEGTLVISEEKEMEDVVVAGVAHNVNEALVSITKLPDRPGVAADIFGALATENIVVDMIIQNVGSDGQADMTFTLTKDDLVRGVELIRKKAKELGAGEVFTNSEITKISIVGLGMRSHAGVAAKMFKTLHEAGVNIHMISTSEIKISCVIDSKFTELAVRELHSAFELDQTNEKCEAK